MLAGLLTTIVAFILYSALIFGGRGVVLANTVSTIVAVFFAYITNKVLVFKALNFSIKNIAKEFAKFSTNRFIVYIIDTVLLIILINILLYDPIFSKVFTSIIVIISNYIGSKKIVFKNYT